jgi:hypothetical protein
MKRAKDAWYRFALQRIRTCAAVIELPQDSRVCLEVAKELIGVLESSLLQRNQMAEVIEELRTIFGRIPPAETGPNAELRLCMKETIRRLS